MVSRGSSLDSETCFGVGIMTSRHSVSICQHRGVRSKSGCFRLDEPELTFVRVREINVDDFLATRGNAMPPSTLCRADALHRFNRNLVPPWSKSSDQKVSYW
jgi:hypothetical protein